VFMCVLMCVCLCLRLCVCVYSFLHETCHTHEHAIALLKIMFLVTPHRNEPRRICVGHLCCGWAPLCLCARMLQYSKMSLQCYNTARRVHVFYDGVVSVSRID